MPESLQPMHEPAPRAALVAFIRRAARPIDKFSHQARLYRLTQQIGAGEIYDDEVVFAAAWLHDLGVFIGHRPENLAQLATWDHVAYVLERTPGILAECGYPPEKVPAVRETIRTHQPADSPTTFEGALLRDADILEQLGATAILRTVSKVGRDTRFATFADALQVLQRHLDQLPDQLRLERARDLAIPRIRALAAFLTAAAAETGPIPW